MVSCKTFALIDFGLLGAPIVKDLENRGHACGLVISDSQFYPHYSCLKATFVSVVDIFEKGIVEAFDSKALEYFRANLDFLRRNAQRWIVEDHNHDDFFYTSFRAFSYCIEILRDAKIDVVFSGIGSPHHYYNLIFYCAAQYLGINHFFFSPIFVTNRVYIREGLSPKIWSISKKYEDSKLIRKFIREATYPKPTTSNLEKHKNFFHNPMGRIFFLGFVFRVAFILRSAIKYVFCRRPYTGIVMLPPEKSYRVFYDIKTIKSVFKTCKLKKFYRSLVSYDLPEKDFVLALGPYQPEATTLPDAEGMADTRLMIAHLRLKLPESIRIVYKEHPGAFLYSNMRFPSTIDDHRSTSFYKDIKKLGVIIADDRINIGTLCDKALLVVGINGTFGIEMALRKKPVFMYGQAWYGKIPGVRIIDYDFDFKDIFSLKTNHSRNDVLDHLLFLNENSLPNLSGTGSKEVQDGDLSEWSDEFHRIMTQHEA